MISSEDLFWNNILKVPQLTAAKSDALQEWGENIPEALLFAYIGRAISDSLELIKEEQRITIFKAIELGLASGDRKLETLIASGLLEALYSRFMANKRPWEQVEILLGRRTKKYIDDWVNWPE